MGSVRAIDEPYVLENDPGGKETKRVAGGAIVSIAGGVVSFALALAYQVVIARRLGPEAFGLVVLALAISRFFAQGADVGLDYGVMRFGGIAHEEKDPGRFRAVLRSAIWGAALVGTVAGVALAASSGLVARFFGKPELAPVIVPLALAVPLFSTREVLRAAMRAKGNAVRPVTATSIVGPAARLITGAWAVWMVPSAPAVAWAYFITEAFVLAAAALMLRPMLEPAQRQPAPARRLYAFSLPLSLNRLLLYSNNQTEVLFLGFLAPSATVGVYGVARRLSSLLSSLMTSVAFLFLPTVAGLHHAQRIDELDRVFKTSTRWLVTIGLPVCIFEVLFAPQLMDLFGEGFRTGAVALVVLAIGQLVNLGTGTVASLQAMAGYAKLTLLNSLLILSMSVVLDLLLVPRFGLLGAAIAASTAVVTVNLLRLWQVHRDLGLVPYDRSFVRPIVAVLPASAAAWFLPLPGLNDLIDLAIRAAVLGIVYIGVLLAQGLQPIDREIARAALGKLTGRRVRSTPASETR